MEFPIIKDRLQKSMGTGSFNAVHIFTPSSDIPDDMALRLVVLPPDAAFSRTGQSIAIDRATETLKTRGDQPRQKQNRLIFLAADYDSVSRLKDQVRSVLAWQSIDEDYKQNRIVIDNLMANTARASLEQAQEALRRMIREAYKWVLAPMQEARNGRGISDLQWENFQLNASSLPHSNLAKWPPDKSVEQKISHQRKPGRMPRFFKFSVFDRSLAAQKERGTAEYLGNISHGSANR